MKDTTSKLKLHSDHALLCLIGHKSQQDNILAPLHRLVKIDQKTVKHSPTEKLQDCLLAIMQGAEAVYQINTLLRSDPAVCKAFGRERCADQSTLQDTLSACDFTNLAQLQTALKQIFQKHSQTYLHDYTQGPLILDLDLTGLPCSRHFEGAEKGYSISRVASLAPPDGNSTGSMSANMMNWSTSKSILVRLVRHN